MNPSEVKDFYERLGASKTASESELKQAYRSLARQWHPDTNSQDRKKECELEFIAISEAYVALSGRSSQEKEGQATKSYKGNKRGRKSINSERLVQKIKELKQQGLSLRDIQKHPEVYFYDKNNNQKKPSLATIHSILKV